MVQRATATADGAELHFIDSGSGDPILFIHAGVADSRMWRDQMDLPGYRSVAFDKRGFGETKWEPSPYSDTEDAVAILDHLGVERAHIVGCSMGGATALELAIDHPERMTSLVLVGAYPSGFVPEDGFDENQLEDDAMAAAERGDFERVIELEMLMWLVGYGRPEDSVVDSLKDLYRVMNQSPVRTEKERNQHQQGFTKKLNEHLEDINVPTLVVIGEHDEALLLDAASHLAKQLSDWPEVIISDTAHLPSLERPELFNKALLSFLDEL